MSKRRSKKAQDKEYDKHVSFTEHCKEFKTEKATLKQLNNNHELRNNDPNVKTAIALDPELSKLKGWQLSRIKKNERRSEQRLMARTAKRFKLGESCQDPSSSDQGDKASDINDPEYKPEETGAVISNKIPQAQGKSIVKSSKRERNIELMIRAAGRSTKDSPFSAAMAKQLHDFSLQSKDEYTRLKSLLIDEQAADLADKLLSGQSATLNTLLKETISKTVIVQAFTRAAGMSDKLIKDQRLLSEYFIPVLTRVKRFPHNPELDIEKQQLVLKACINFYCSQKEPNPPIELYLYAHSFGQIRKCIEAFRGCKHSERLIKQFLFIQSLDKGVIQVFCNQPEKLCYSKFIDLCADLTPDVATQLSTIVSKCEVYKEPAADARQLEQRLRRNLQLAFELQYETKAIDMKVGELENFLAQSEGMKANEVRAIIKDHESKDWLSSLKNLKRQMDSGRAQDLCENDKWLELCVQQQIEELYNVTLDFSKDFEKVCESYHHNRFQCFAVSKVLIPTERIKVLIAPTGSGKTYIGCLIAYILHQKGKKVAYVTPNNWLAKQVEQQIGSFRHQIKVLEFSDALGQIDAFDSVICDEGDELITKSKVVINQLIPRIHGFWDLLGKEAILLTASATFDMQTVLREVYNIRPASYVDMGPWLKQMDRQVGSIHFQFSSSVDDKTHSERIEEVIADWYTDEPIIVYVDNKELHDTVDQIIKRFDIPKLLIRNLKEVNSSKIIAKRMERGVAIVNREFGRGLDLRFKEDANVLVTFLPADIDEAKQLAGRSSRTMKSHHCAVLIKDAKLQSEDIQEYLETAGKSSIKDGARVVKAILGARMDDEYVDDSELLKLVKNTWRIDLKTIVRKLGQQRHADLESLYAYGRVVTTAVSGSIGAKKT